MPGTKTYSEYYGTDMDPFLVFLDTSIWKITTGLTVGFFFPPAAEAVADHSIANSSLTLLFYQIKP